MERFSWGAPGGAREPGRDGSPEDDEQDGEEGEEEDGDANGDEQHHQGGRGGRGAHCQDTPGFNMGESDVEENLGFGSLPCLARGDEGGESHWSFAGWSEAGGFHRFSRGSQAFQGGGKRAGALPGVGGHCHHHLE